MKSLKTLATAVLCSMIFQAVPNLARAVTEGNSSGGGQGDHAFALQKLAQANPGLKPEQILFKAFEQSQGRLPKMVRVTNERVSNEMAAFLPGAEAASVFDPSVFHSYIVDETLEEWERGDTIFYAVRPKAADSGPLIAMKSQPWGLRARSKSDLLIQDWGDLQIAPSGLIAYSHGFAERGKKMESDSINGTGYIQVEFRQYTSDMLIFAVKPTESGKCGRYRVNSDGVCAIGYFWK